MIEFYFQFECLPKSLNVKLRKNRWARSRENKTWDMLIEMQIGGKRPRLECASLSIIRHSFRTLDFDGLVGSMKPVVDALVSAGVIKDDTWDVLGKWDVDQKFRPKRDGNLLEVFIREVKTPPGLN